MSWYDATEAPNDPLAAVPARLPGSLRRTMHVDVGARQEWVIPLPIAGGARDLRTGDDPADPEVLDEVRVEATFDRDRSLVEIAADPPADWVAQLVGTRAGGGFRRTLAELVPPSASSSLLRQVIDDMPAAALISGYAILRVARRAGVKPASLTPPNAIDHMVDLCSGWRAGGTAASSIGSGEGIPMQDTPPAPHLVGVLHGSAADDAWAWHDMPLLPPDHMRRRRLLDVQARSDGSFTVWAMFRDTVGEDDGSESVLHEYAVRAVGAHGVLVAVEAEPRVLPFKECPGAADFVNELAGMPVAQLALTVPDTLTSTHSCTHLNDLLRALGGLTGLLAVAAAT